MLKIGHIYIINDIYRKCQTASGWPEKNGINQLLTPLNLVRVGSVFDFCVEPFPVFQT